MSLFDVLRYPISYPPTKAELDALPTELYMKWIMNSDWAQFVRKDKVEVYSSRNVSEWYYHNINNSFVFKEQDANDIKRLHSIILEWET